MKMIAEATIIQFARLAFEAMAMNDAALADDLDEARFRAQLIRREAGEMGLLDIEQAASDIALLLRPPGTEPLPGYGGAMLRLAKLLTPDRSDTPASAERPRTL